MPLLDRTTDAKVPDTTDSDDSGGVAEAADDITTAISATPTSAIFKSAKAVALSTKLGIPARESKERPPVRQVCYLIVDANTLNNSASHRTLREELDLIAEARDFYINEDNDGNLVIMSLSEREGVEKLADIEKSFRKIQGIKMLFNIGHIEHIPTRNQFNLKNYPETGTTAKWRKPGPPNRTTIIKKNLATAIKDPNQRVGSNLDIYTTPANTEDPDDLYLIEAIHKVSAEQGGPDTLVGYEEPYSKLENYATDEETSLIILEGAAWKGKSRLRTELCKKLTSHILCSANASDSNVLGSSLATLAKQLHTAIKEDPLLKTLATEQFSSSRLILDGEIVETGDPEIDQKAITLIEFINYSNADQNNLCAKHPEMITKMCVETLKAIQSRKDPRTLLIIEDIHHADRLSLPFLMQIVKSYISETKGKVLLTKRPEEGNEAKDFDNLMEDTLEAKGPNSVKKVSINQGLDFSKPEIAAKFAYHSLPVAYRTGRKLTNWPQKLARLAGNTPGYFKALMDIVLEKNSDGEYKNLFTDTDGNIELDDEFAKELDSYSSGDMETYLNQRISRLPTPQLKMLQCLALLGQPAHAITVLQLAMKSGTVNAEDDNAYEKVKAVYSPLIEGGYIIESKDEKGDAYYKLQHESMQRIAVESIKPENRKLELAKFMHPLVKDNQHVPLEGEHNIASVMADSYTTGTINDKERDFWKYYQDLSNQLLEKIAKTNDNEHLAKVCKTILGSKRIQAAIVDIEKNYYSSNILAEFATNTLITAADAARFLGRFEEVDSLITSLRKIDRNTRLNTTKINLIAFERAYLDSNVAEMKAALWEILNRSLVNAPHVVHVMMKIKIAYKENKFSEVVSIYKENESALIAGNLAHIREKGQPSPTYVEIKRIATARSPFQEVNDKAKRVTPDISFDEDAIHQRIALSPDQYAKLLQLDRVTDEIKGIQKSYPFSMDRYGEFGLIDQIAESAAYSGERDRAIKLYGEAWRLAKQMKLHDRAARAARFKGNQEVLKAIQKGPDSILTSKQRADLLKKAIATYGEKGTEKNMQSLNILDKQNFNQLLTRIKRIRAISLLIKLQDNEADDEESENPLTSEELRGFIKAAIEDFTYINEQFSTYSDNAEILYYTLGTTGPVIEAALKEGILDEAGLKELSEKLPYLNSNTVQKALQYAKNMTDLGSEEVDRKFNGLEKLELLIGNFTHRQEKGLFQEKATDVEKYQLESRIYRISLVSKLAVICKDNPDADFDLDLLKSCFAQAVQDMRYLGIQDFANKFPEQYESTISSANDINIAAKALGIDLTEAKTTTLNTTNIDPETFEDTVNHLYESLKKVKVVNFAREKQKRTKRDAELLEKRSKEAQLAA